MFKRGFIAVCLGVAAAAGAQSNGFYTDGRPMKIFNPASGLNQQDMAFMKEAAAANRFEIESSRIAAANGGSDYTQEFSKEMIGDHQACQNELIQIAQSKNFGVSLPLPTALDAALNHLRNLHGAAVDNNFRDWQIKGHEAAVDLYKQEIQNGHDQDVKAFAVKTLPTVELHLHLLLAGKTMMGPTAADHGM